MDLPPFPVPPGFPPEIKPVYGQLQGDMINLSLKLSLFKDAFLTPENSEILFKRSGDAFGQQRLVIQHAFDGRCESAWVSRGGEQHRVSADLWQRAGVGSHYWNANRHSLENGQSKTLIEGRLNKQACTGIELGSAV